jgi:hypothetical protein
VGSRDGKSREPTDSHSSPVLLSLLLDGSALTPLVELANISRLSLLLLSPALSSITPLFEMKVSVPSISVLVFSRPGTGTAIAAVSRVMGASVVGCEGSAAVLG